MMKKKCNKCCIEKDISEFYFRKDQNKYRNDCKACLIKKSREYRHKNKEIILKKKKNKYIENSEIIKKRVREYKKNNPEKVKETNIKYRQTENYKINQKKYLSKNKTRIKKRKYMRKYHDVNKNKNEYKLPRLLRKRIYDVVNKNVKSSSTRQLLGCTIKELKNWLGIINNYDGSKLHIDHIIPCNLYDLTKESEQMKCFNYRNLRLCHTQENLIKHDKLDIHLIKCYGIEDLLPKEYYNRI